MSRKHKKLKGGILFLIVINVVLIILAPFFNIKFWSLSEDISEAIFVSSLFLLMALLFGFYSREVDKYKKQQEELEERLRETFKYIGSINLQLEEMKKVFRSVNKYPESKKDIQALFVHTAERILGIINVDWVTLKIVDVETGNSLHEYFISRGRKKIDKVKIDNKELLNGGCSFGSCSIVKSNQENFNIKAFCILPTVEKNDNQEFLINSIVNQLEMLFIIFNSLYYKKRPS
jgi:hypothetical protein